jgi:hypothetical protein
MVKIVLLIREHVHRGKIIFYDYRELRRKDYKMLENQLIYRSPKGSKLIFFAPHGVGVNEENQLNLIPDSRYSYNIFDIC